MHTIVWSSSAEHTITVAPVSRPPALVDYIARSVRRPPATTQSELRYVVVYVDGAPPPTALPTETVAMRQIAETFEPGVLAVTRGSTVEFPNDDPFFHNVFSLSRAASFDLGRYERSRTLNEVGFVKVFCDLHAYMSAVILVLDHPYCAAPGDDGLFVIDNVPPGTLTVSAWHERIGEIPDVPTPADRLRLLSPDPREQLESAAWARTA